MTTGGIFGGEGIGARGAALLRRLAPLRCAEYTGLSSELQRFSKVA
jgi:hypothetical protein